MYTIRRISSQLFTTLLRRTSSSTNVAPATPATETSAEDASSGLVSPNEDGPTQGNTSTPNDTNMNSKDASDEELSTTLPPSSNKDKDGMLVDLPYTLDVENQVIIHESGYLRAFVVEDDVHLVLRSKPEIAFLIKNLELVIPPDVDNVTLEKNMDEWSLTVESLEKLERIAILGNYAETAPSQMVDGWEMLKAVKGIKSLRMLELKGIDAPWSLEDLFEGSEISSVKMVDCTKDVAVILSRMKKLTSVEVVEQEWGITGGYLKLLSEAEALTSISIALPFSNRTIELDDFLSAFQNRPLSKIQCNFSTIDETPESIEQRLCAAFPLYAQSLSGEVPVSTQSLDDKSAAQDMEMESEMGVLTTSALQNTSATPRKNAISRTAIVEKAKEAMRISELAAKEKSKISGSYRKHLKR
ncbi:hypothetical protein FRC03_003552 [Tulasnella sp. 419]|nr:hypothetical protein FRC03_003552 [Tulasnella sp. 419]